MKLNDLLRSLEDSGEVNYGLAEHKLDKDDAGNFTVKSLVPVCFVLDPVKSKRKKHKAKSQTYSIGFFVQVEFQ